MDFFFVMLSSRLPSQREHKILCSSIVIEVELKIRESPRVALFLKFQVFLFYFAKSTLGSPRLSPREGYNLRHQAKTVFALVHFIIRSKCS
jgi:hypothetical protein